MQNNHWAWLKDERGQPPDSPSSSCPAISVNCRDYPTAPGGAVAGCGLLQQEGSGLLRRVCPASWLGQQMAWQPIDEVNLADRPAEAKRLAAAARRRIRLVTPASSVASISPERRVEGSCTKGLADICSRLAMIQTPLVSAKERNMENQNWQRYMLEAEKRPWHGGSGRRSAPLSAGPKGELASGIWDGPPACGSPPVTVMADFMAP